LQVTPPEFARREKSNLRNAAPAGVTRILVTDASFRTPWLREVVAPTWNWLQRLHELPQHVLNQISPQKSGGDQEALLQTLGERVLARTFERQVVELHVRVALLKLGRPATVPVDAMA